MLAGLNRQEPDKGNLHAGQGSKSIPRRVADVEAVAVAAHADEDKGVQGKDAGDEGVAAPRSHHVSVEESAESAPEHGAKLESLDPEIEGEDEKENGDGLIVVAARDGSRDVAGGNAHEGRGEETGRRRGGHLVGKEIGGKGRQAGEGGREEHANVSNVDGDSESSEGVVDDTAGDHQARVERSSGHTTERMPCSVIEPVPELVEAVRNEVLGSSEVEPRIDWRGSARAWQVVNSGV